MANARRPWTWLLVLALLPAASCAKPGDDSAAKRQPIPEPAPDVEIPEGWTIPVETAVGAKTLTAKVLASSKPDFADEERKAWRLDKLLSDSEFPLDSLAHAVGDDGVGIAMKRSGSADAAVPVIVLTRRGDVVAAAIKPSDPFPIYHGQGGRLRRPGDPLPRLISPLAKLSISTDAPAQEPLATIEALKLQVGAKDPVALSPDVLAKVSPRVIAGDSGGERTIWNARELVAAAAGKGAKLVGVHGDEEVEIAASDWDSPAHIPVLQLNRRGQLKFVWHKESPSDGGSPQTAEVKGKPSVRSVRLLRIAP